jgi:hypothetical protein
VELDGKSGATGRVVNGYHSKPITTEDTKVH